MRTCFGSFAFPFFLNAFTLRSFFFWLPKSEVQLILDFHSPGRPSNRSALITVRSEPAQGLDLAISLLSESRSAPRSPSPDPARLSLHPESLRLPTCSCPATLSSPKNLSPDPARLCLSLDRGARPESLSSLLSFEHTSSIQSGLPLQPAYPRDARLPSTLPPRSWVPGAPVLRPDPRA